METTCLFEMSWLAPDQSWFSSASGCKGTVKRSTGPKQDNWCWVDPLFVVQAIGARSIPSHVLHAANYYIAFCFLLLCFITERQLSLEESRSPQMNSKKREGGFRAGTNRESLHSPLKRRTTMDKNTLSMDLKGGLWLL